MADQRAQGCEHNDGARPQRVAVLVIAGVGDKPSGSASEALTGGLLCHGKAHFHHAERFEEEYAPAASWCGEDPEPAQSVTRHTLFGPDGKEVADVYEAWWADLSRFRGATRSALLATIGMLQQATTIGCAALRGGGALYANPKDRPDGQDNRGDSGFRLGARLLAVIEWLLAVPVVCIVAIHLALMAAADYAMLTNGARARHDLVGLAVVALLLVMALVVGVRWYSRRRPGVALVGVPLLIGAITVAAWRSTVHGNFADAGISDAILVLAIYPLRVAWMLIAALALVTVACLGIGALIRRPKHPARRISTAALSMFGPFGLGLVGALVYAAAGAALQKLASLHAFSGGDMPWCLPSLTSWTPGTCPLPQAIPPSHTPPPFTAYDWGVGLFQTGVVPLIYVGGLVLLTFGGTAIGVAVSLVTDRLRSGRRVTRTVFLRRLFRVSPGAVAFALAPAAALVLLTYVPGGDHVLVWQKGGTGPVGSIGAVVAAATGWAIGGLLAAGRALKLGTGTLRNQGTIGDGVRVPLDIAYDIATFLREPTTPLPVSLPLTPHAAELARLRSIVPRQRIIGRFSALLAHIKEVRTYDRCVIVSHSQGTVLATALLARPAGAVHIPGDHVSLVTMGTPLRRVYSQRLPLQFAWVDRLLDDQDGFVCSLDGQWLNFGADGDLVGRTVFTDECDEGEERGPIGKAHQPVPGRSDWNIGPGGHASYWTSAFVMEQIAALIAGQPTVQVVGTAANGLAPAAIPGPVPAGAALNDDN